MYKSFQILFSQRKLVYDPQKLKHHYYMYTAFTGLKMKWNPNNIEWFFASVKSQANIFFLLESKAAACGEGKAICQRVNASDHHLWLVG